jgi:putative ABC transport system substrate-binding protein
MRRRDVIAVLAGAATLPFAAIAQQAHVPRVGLISLGADPGNPVVFVPFLEQMRALGYVDGQNIVFERRFAAGRSDLLDEFAADLIRRRVDVIVVTGQRESIAASRATSSIPIVMVINPDPIGLGLARSLPRPGGNVTSLTTIELELYGKRIELLKETLPTVRRAALLISHGNPTYGRDSPWARQVEEVSRSRGVQIDLIEAESTTMEGVIAAAAARGAQALLGASDGVIVAARKEIADSAIRLKLPTVFSYRSNVVAGGLLSYSAKVEDMSRRAWGNPADLPIEQATTFEMVVNLKTARILGIEIPPLIVAQADEVIE